MLLVGNIFNMTDNKVYLVCVKRSNFQFTLPALFNLYVNGEFYREIIIEGIVLNNNYFIDEFFDKITVWSYGFLNKEFINDKSDVVLKLNIG